MAIQIPQGYKVTSVEPIDSRFVLTKAQMLEYSSRDDLMPPVYFCVGAERDDVDHYNIYIYNRYEAPEIDTGKFHPFRADYRLLANTPKAGDAINPTLLVKEPPYDGWVPTISVMYDSEDLMLNEDGELALSLRVVNHLNFLLNKVIILDSEDMWLQYQIDSERDARIKDYDWLLQLINYNTFLINSEAERAKSSEGWLKSLIDSEHQHHLEGDSEIWQYFNNQVIILNDRIDSEHEHHLEGDSEIWQYINNQFIIVNNRIDSEHQHHLDGDSEIWQYFNNQVIILNDRIDSEHQHHIEGDSEIWKVLNWETSERIYNDNRIYIYVDSELAKKQDLLPLPRIPDSYLHVNSETSELEWYIPVDRMSNPIYVAALYSNEDEAGGAGALGNCNVIHQNGKAFIIDLGATSTCSALIDYIEEKNLIISGLAISHFDTDNIGDNTYSSAGAPGAANFFTYLSNHLDRIDGGVLNIYYPHAHMDTDPDSHKVAKVIDVENRKWDFQNALQNLSPDPNHPKHRIISPEEDTTIQIENYTITFNNLSETKFNKYYDRGRDSRGAPHDSEGAAYNDFSMIVTAKAHGKKIVFPGDIYYEGEVQNRSVLAYPDIYFVENHGINYVGDADFLDCLYPKVAFVQGWGVKRSALTAYQWGRSTCYKLLTRGIPIIHNVEAGMTEVTITRDGGIDVHPSRTRNRTSYPGEFAVGIGLIKGVNIDEIGGDSEFAIPTPGKFTVPDDIPVSEWLTGTLPDWAQILTGKNNPIQIEVSLIGEGANQKVLQTMSHGEDPFEVSKRRYDRDDPSGQPWTEWRTIKMN